jgi:hypothetical protein
MRSALEAAGHHLTVRARTLRQTADGAGWPNAMFEQPEGGKLLRTVP